MRTISLLIKPASGSCNMRCRYCFYADVADSRVVKSRGIMSAETLEIVVKKALSETRSHCVIGFQGGEPTLAGLDFFHLLIELERKHNTNGIKVSYALQTNGLLLDDDWARLFRENNFLVGLSIDCTKRVHDYLRADSAKNGTHNRCMAAARLLVKHRVDFNILSVVTRQLAAHPDTAYHFYKQNGFRYIQFIPCLDDLNKPRGESEYSLTSEDYGSFLCRIFDLWYTDFAKNDYYSIRAFDNYIQMLAGYPPESCAMSGVCNPYALVEADGSVYPCDFYAIDEFLLGNVQTHSFADMLNGERAEAFAEPSRHYPAACLSCEYYFICRGGCRRDREPATNGQLPTNYYCAAYKKFFAHALPRMNIVARSLR